MAELNDEQLVDCFRTTEKMEHFDELVRRHIAKVRSMTYAMVLNDADADELTQEVFMRVVRSIQRFKRKARFSTWLHRITMNTTYGFLKKRGRSPLAQVVELPDQPDPIGDPSDAVARNETESRVNEALASLSPPLRAAITLTAIQGMSPADAARAEGCLTATMYWRIHEARRLMRAKLRLQHDE